MQERLQRVRATFVCGGLGGEVVGQVYKQRYAVDIVIKKQVRRERTLPLRREYAVDSDLIPRVVISFLWRT